MKRLRSHVGGISYTSIYQSRTQSWSNSFTIENHMAQSTFSWRYSHTELFFVSWNGSSWTTHWDTVTTFFFYFGWKYKNGMPFCIIYYHISLVSIKKTFFSLKLEGVLDNYKTVNLVLRKSFTTALREK